MNRKTRGSRDAVVSAQVAGRWLGRRALLMAAALTPVAAVVPAPWGRAAPRVIVRMTNALEFAPGTVTVGQGDTVEWRNTSHLVHTVTCDPAEAADPEAHVRMPDGASAFDSGRIAPKATYRRTFAVKGRYRYFCVPHEGAGMIGEVVVQ